MHNFLIFGLLDCYFFCCSFLIHRPLAGTEADPQRRRDSQQPFYSLLAGPLAAVGGGGGKAASEAGEPPIACRQRTPRQTPPALSPRPRRATRRTSCCGRSRCGTRWWRSSRATCRTRYPGRGPGAGGGGGGLGNGGRGGRSVYICPLGESSHLFVMCLVACVQDLLMLRKMQA